MQSAAKIAVIIGSLRKASYSRKVAHALIARAPSDLSCQIVEIAGLAMYNEDIEENPPEEWKRFRRELRDYRGVLFVTPEYNRSIPGCLKNALDVGSRPQDASVWNGLPVGVVSVTPYKLGGFGANHALRQTFVYLNMPVLQQPEAYVSGAGELFDGEGNLKNSETDKFFTEFMMKLSHWIATVRSSTPLNP